jgi:hypothetical protein
MIFLNARSNVSGRFVGARVLRGFEEALVFLGVAQFA